MADDSKAEDNHSEPIEGDTNLEEKKDDNVVAGETKEDNTNAVDKKGVSSTGVKKEKDTNTSEKKEKLAEKVSQNSQVRLEHVSQTPSSYIETLPKAVKRRINALKQLQVKCAHIEAKFYEEVHELERKYATLYQPLLEKRREVVNGDVEPTDEECEWHSETEDEEKLAESLKTKASITEETKDETHHKGVPDFWLTIFRNVDILCALVQEYDEPILKHLQDIKVKFSDPGQPMSFSLEFHFESNEYFTNPVLTKTYKMKSEPDALDPFSFEGPEIVDCEGCTIEWKKGKNVTVKTIKKKQKHKGRGTVRTITKQVPNDSFFNFFSPIKACEEGEALDEDSEFTLATDFEIGHFFRERIVPRAVLYFTGEAIEDEDSFEELEEGEEEEVEGEEADEDDDANCDLKE
ncbi:nucleosome assembly protein 1-like 4 isoform X2 [Pleurodeles waltl]|uniref:nucleosome assembly protein 1-like 4 isoform X2 n=1 Tax=Pleurodeles waltl TaxID=8319 RepID=UPI003709C4E1